MFHFSDKVKYHFGIDFLFINYSGDFGFRKIYKIKANDTKNEVFMEIVFKKETLCFEYARLLF